MDASPSASCSQFNFLMAVTDWLVSKNLKDMYPQHFTEIPERLLTALQHGWKQVKCKNNDDRVVEFDKLDKSRIRLFFNAADLNKAMDNLRNPRQSRDAIVNCCAKNQLGQSMFGETAHTLLSHEVTHEIRERILTLKDHKLTKETFGVLVVDTHARAMIIDSKKLLRPKRMCKRTYRNQLVEVKCDTVMFEIEVALHMRIKEWALFNGKIHALHVEKELIADSSQPLLGDVVDDLWYASKQARQQMNVVLSAFQSNGTDTVTSTLASKRETCEKIDKYFVCEVGWLNGMCGEEGKRVILDSLLDTFPDDRNQANLDQVNQDLAKLQKSSLMQFVGEEVSGQIQAAAEIVSALKHLQPPEFAKNKCIATINSVIDKCQYFLKMTVAEDEGQMQELIGAPVLAQRCKELQSVMKKEKPDDTLTGQHLDDLRVYWWLVEPGWRPLIFQAEQVLRLKHGVDIQSTASSSISSSTAPEAKKAKLALSEKGKLSRAQSLRDSVLSRV